MSLSVMSFRAFLSMFSFIGCGISRLNIGHESDVFGVQDGLASGNKVLISNSSTDAYSAILRATEPRYGMCLASFHEDLLFYM